MHADIHFRTQDPAPAIRAGLHNPELGGAWIALEWRHDQIALHVPNVTDLLHLSELIRSAATELLDDEDTVDLDDPLGEKDISI